MMEWTEEVISFRKDAALWNGTEKKLADAVEDFIPQGATVCDAGCGLGYLSLYLAEKGYEVIAVDRDEKVLAVLRENKEQQGLLNIHIRCADIFYSPPSEKYGIMLFCSFGKTAEILELMKKQCRRKGIIIKRNWDRHRFTTKDSRIDIPSFERTCKELTALGIPYEKTMLTVETGQPFRTLEAAVRFFEIHDPQKRLQQSDVIRRLRETASRDFPYFFPCEREMGIIVLESGNIPD